MGCCFSSPTRHSAPQNGGSTRHHDLRPKPQTPELARVAVDDRAPPPSLELYVKEVLSETHLPKLHPEPAVMKDGDQTQKMPVVSEEKIEAKQQIDKVVQEVSLSQVSEMCDLSEVSHSQFSEMCSVSESFSAATTFTEKRDDEVVSKPSADVAQRVVRSPAKVPRKRAYAEERGPVQKSPARSSQRSSGTRPTRAVARCRIRQQSAGYSGVLRDPGEGSDRLARSAVTRGTGGAGRGGVGRSPMKRTGRGGGRSQSQGNTEGPPNGVLTRRHENESLESPHVSLECFIFL